MSPSSLSSRIPQSLAALALLSLLAALALVGPPPGPRILLVLAALLLAASHLARGFRTPPPLPAPPGDGAAEALDAFRERIQGIPGEAELLGALEQALRRLPGSLDLGPSLEVDLLLCREDGGLDRFPPRDPGGEAPAAILGDGSLCRAHREGARVVLPSAAPTACLCPLGVPGTGAYACLPLVAGGRSLGLVNLRCGKADAWTRERLAPAQAHVSLAAAALQTLRALRLAEERAIHDGLTGAYNRRFLEEILPRMADQAQRQSQPLAILRLDLRLAVAPGRETAGRLRMAFARSLRDQVRSGDILARLEGDAFAILLPHTSHRTALALGERLRQTVSALRLPPPEFPPDCRLACALGVATLPDHGETGMEILAAAERALAREGGA